MYRVAKSGVTSLAVRAALARQCGVSARFIALPALKDRRAVAVQHLSIPGRPPAEMEGDGWRATALGSIRRPLGPRDIAANRFAITVRNLAPSEATRLGAALAAAAHAGLPNAFDRQRFGSYAPGLGFPGAFILRRDAESALRCYLSEPMLGDPGPVRRFKREAAGRFHDWEALFAAAPRPSNYRSVLTFLKDHPTAYRKALNLVPDRLLSLWLAAYQSWLWNRALALASEALAFQTPARVPIVDGLPPQPVTKGSGEGVDAHARRLVLPLPHARAETSDPVARRAMARALAEEGIAVGDLKARILKRAYLGSGERAAWLLPRCLEVSRPEDDTVFAGRRALRVAFELPPGSYATWVIRAAMAAHAD